MSIDALMRNHQDALRAANQPEDRNDTFMGVAFSGIVTFGALSLAKTLAGRVTDSSCGLTTTAVMMLWFTLSHQAPQPVSFYLKYLNRHIRHVMEG